MKKIQKSILRAALSGVALMFAQQAQAASWLITGSGQVTTGQDTSGLFGFAPRTQLGGVGVLTEFIYDDAAPGLITYGNRTTQGYFVNEGNSPISARVKINGHSASLGSEYFGPPPSPFLQISDRENFGSGRFFDGIYIVAMAGLGRIDMSFGSITSDFLSSVYLADGTHYTLTPSDLFNGGSVYLAGSGRFNNVPIVRSANFSIKYSEFTVRKIGDGPASHFSSFLEPQVDFGTVPEPASWALMIFGFGAVGAASRKRRTARSVIA